MGNLVSSAKQSASESRAKLRGARSDARLLDLVSASTPRSSLRRRRRPRPQLAPPQLATPSAASHGEVLGSARSPETSSSSSSSASAFVPSPAHDGASAAAAELAAHAHEASALLPWLFLSGELPPRDAATLARLGVKVVINCAGEVVPNAFERPGSLRAALGEAEGAAGAPGDVSYLSLCLRDGNFEDVFSLFHRVIRAIEAARRAGGAALLHCHQGVSRSATFAIAYLMWAAEVPFKEAYAYARAARPIVSPNAGFTCQLVEWESHLRALSRARLTSAPALAEPSLPIMLRLVRLFDGSHESGPLLVQQPLAQTLEPAASAPLSAAAAAAAAATAAAAGTGAGAGDEPPRRQLLVSLQPVRSATDRALLPAAPALVRAHSDDVLLIVTGRCSDAARGGHPSAPLVEVDAAVWVGRGVEGCLRASPLLTVEDGQLVAGSRLDEAGLNWDDEADVDDSDFEVEGESGQNSGRCDEAGEAGEAGEAAFREGESNEAADVDAGGLRHALRLLGAEMRLWRDLAAQPPRLCAETRAAMAAADPRACATAAHVEVAFDTPRRFEWHVLGAALQDRSEVEEEAGGGDAGSRSLFCSELLLLLEERCASMPPPLASAVREELASLPSRASGLVGLPSFARSPVSAGENLHSVRVRRKASIADASERRSVVTLPRPEVLPRVVPSLRFG
jgi:hypothetical protein